MEALELAIVVVAVALAAVYTVRSFRRQFDRSDDAADDCAGCLGGERRPRGAGERRGRWIGRIGRD